MTKSMTQGNPAKLILMFALPLIVGNIFQQFYSMADTVIVGRTIGVNALAAVGCTGSLTFFIIGFVMGFTSGLSIITSQRFGAQDEEGIKKSFAVSIVLSAVVSVVLTVIAVFLARPLLELLQTPAEIIEDATIYIRIIFMGIAATVLFNLASNMMRALGDSRTPLYFLVFACCVNIILDIVLIVVFDMGVAGAGVATIFSQLLSGVACFIFIMKKMPVLWVQKRHFHITAKEVKKHLNTALPMAFQMSIIAIGALILQFALNGLGAISVAAYTAAQKIDAIATMPMNSFGAAMATYGAQNYGAGKIDRIKKGVFQCIIMSVGFSIVMGFVNIFAGSNLAALFVGKGETEVLSLARTYLTINGVFYSVLALLFIYRFTLQGLGKGFMPTVAGVMELVMRAFGALILVSAIGFAGACWANTLAWIGACIPLAVAYYVTIRKLSSKDLQA
ncbi:MAG: MATE family efflux transporter [Clostridia bacterium]|nr:MATE family efflux transporter [Clostridia bacterium]NCC43991.1 MATE family efflux transporter [Clostridia bacterium]